MVIVVSLKATTCDKYTYPTGSKTASNSPSIKWITVVFHRLVILEQEHEAFILFFFPCVANQREQETLMDGSAFFKMLQCYRARFIVSITLLHLG